MAPRTRASPATMDEVVEQVQVLILRQVQLTATKRGEFPPPIPAKLITPSMTKVLNFQLPEVTAGLELLQTYLLDLCEAGSLTVAELIDELRSCPTVFETSSKADVAARQFIFNILGRALTEADNNTASASSIWEGLYNHHLAFMLDGLVAFPVFEDFADCASTASGSISDTSSTTMLVPFKKTPGLAALEQSLSLLSRQHLVSLVNLALERLEERFRTSSGSVSGMLSSAFHLGGASSARISDQMALLSAMESWHFSLLDEGKHDATCRLLQAMWDTVIPEVQRSSQKRVVLVTLTKIWCTLSKEVHNSARPAGAWKEMLGPEPKVLEAVFELQEHFVSIAQKWIRKQKIRDEALAFLQVLLCHGKSELFKSKHRGFFVTALVAACNDGPSRLGALPIVAAYLEQAPEASVGKIREVWKGEVLTLVSAAFPRRAPCQATEMKALTDTLTAIARTDLRLAVTAIQGVLTSTRHHATQKIVGLRAIKELMVQYSSSKILDLDSTLLQTVLGCVAEKTELDLAAEALNCLAPLWSLLPATRVAPPQEAERGPKAAVQSAVQSKEEVLEVLEELTQTTDKSVSSIAIKALRELSPLLSSSELLTALGIVGHAITSDLQASVQKWTASLDDVQSFLASLKTTLQAASREERRACSSPRESGVPALAAEPIIPQAQWCKTRVQVEGLSLLGLMHPDQRVWNKARGVLTKLNDSVFQSLEAPPDANPIAGRPHARNSAPEAVLRKSSVHEIEEIADAAMENRDGASSPYRSASSEKPESNGQTETVLLPFLADALLCGQPQGLDAEVWERRSSAVGVVWAPELWPFLVRQSDKYFFCIEWAWNKIRKHRAESKSKTQGEDTSSVSSPTMREAADQSPQVQRNHVYFLCLCMRETQHPELDLDEAAKGRKRQVFQWADVAAKPGLPLMTSKGVMGRKTVLADETARGWLKKRRMTRAAVRDCLRQIWEHIQGIYEGVAGDETAQLLLCVDAIHPSCHEDLILELKRFQTQQRLGPVPLSTTSHHSSGASINDMANRKAFAQQPGSPTKRHDGAFEFQTAGTSDFYYEENVLYVLAGLYGRTSAEEYRAAPAPVRSAIEEFVGAWTREQDLSGFAGLSLKVRMYAVRIIELYLLYTTAAVQAAVAHTGASGADRAEQEALFVPSLAYRTNIFKCLTAKWNHGLSAAGGSSKTDELGRSGSKLSGRSSERPTNLDEAIAKAVAALTSMGPLKDREFENTLLRYLQTYHAKGSTRVRAQVVETMAIFLRHNPHRVRSFIAGSFAQLHRLLEKEEASALALTYFKALARSVSSELEEWLMVRGLHPAKIIHLCLLHMTSTGEPFRHVALELLATLESVAEQPAALLQGVLPASNDAPPEMYMPAALTTSINLAAAHPEYTVAMIKEALSLQQILSKDVLPTILTLIQPWACNFAAVLEDECRAADLAAAIAENKGELVEADDRSVSEVLEQSPRVRTLVERMPNLQNLRSSYTEEEEELTSPLPAAGKGSVETRNRNGTRWKDESDTSRKSSLEGVAKDESGESIRSVRKGSDPKEASGKVSDKSGENGLVRSGSLKKQAVEGDLKPRRSSVHRGLERGFSEVSVASSTDVSTVSRGEEENRPSRKRTLTEAKPISNSEQTLLCLFQITRTCGSPPTHAHLLRGVWQGLVSAPLAVRDDVATYVADFLLLCHMSRAEGPENGHVPKKQSGVDAPGRKTAGAGLDQRLAKLLLVYLLNTDCGEAVLQRLVNGVRSYNTTAPFDSSTRPMHIAWEKAGLFTPEPVGQKEHSALILLADAAYHQDMLLVAHLPQLLHMAIVLLRPRTEHLWAHKAAGSFHLCLESHALIAHLLHSLAIRYAPSNSGHERAQTFLDTYYGGDRKPSKEGESGAQGPSGDPEERLTTSYLFELISLLQPFRPELRPEWADCALAWAASALDKRVVIDSLRVFAVVNKSVQVDTLVKVESLLLGALHLKDYAVADSVLDVFVKAVTRLCRQDPSRSASAQFLPPSGAWEHVTATAFTALSCTNVRMFHKALTMAQILIESRPDAARDGALDEFWKLQGRPVDETIHELLFPGLLDEKTALGTLSLLETLAKAHVLSLPADNKLTVLVLLVNIALVQSGQTQRCGEALRIVESGGCALADLSAILTAQLTGKYSSTGRPSSPPTFPRKQRTTSYTYGQKEKEHVAALASPSVKTGVEATPKKAEANGASEEAARPKRRLSRHPFLEEFFNAFSLAFPSEYTWTFSLQCLLSLVSNGPAIWREPLTAVLSSLLYARAHAWTTSHFEAVADVIGAVGHSGEVKRSQARGDIRALLREYAPPGISQRVFDAIHPLENLREKSASTDLRPSLSLPPGKRAPAAAVPPESLADAPWEFLPGYTAGSQAAKERLERAEVWLEYLLAKERRQSALKQSLLQGGRMVKHVNQSSDSLEPQASSAEPEAVTKRSRPLSAASHDGSTASGLLERLVQPTMSSQRRNSLVEDVNERFQDSLRQPVKQSSSRERTASDSQTAAHENGQSNGSRLSASIVKGKKDKAEFIPSIFSLIGVNSPSSSPGHKPLYAEASRMKVEEWALNTSGQWHEIGNSVASEPSSTLSG